jgi:anti-sigma factor RsiW
MNHDFIATHDVIARYVASRLSAEEEREFEAHLVDCVQCTGEAEQELALREGLGAAAAVRTTAQPAAAVRRPAAPVERWSSRGLRLLQAAAAVLVAVALGLALSLARTSSALNAALNERE